MGHKNKTKSLTFEFEGGGVFLQHFLKVKLTYGSQKKKHPKNLKKLSDSS